MAVANGALLPLDAPGLGVDLDEAKLAAYRVD
jgi:L-alanine-DL-glutamate epimerase-like enolase superfamily enzyme